MYVQGKGVWYLVLQAQGQERAQSASAAAAAEWMGAILDSTRCASRRMCARGGNFQLLKPRNDSNFEYDNTAAI